MIKTLLTLSLFIVNTVLFAQQQRRILIVSTNVDSVGSNRSGTYLPEIAHPFKNFTDKGYSVDVVTPGGGKAAIYEAKVNTELAQIRDSKAFIDKPNIHFLLPK